MSSERYLTHFRPDLLSGSVDEMVQAGRLQDKVTLVEYLSGALEHLKTVPGPHLQYRRDNADDWIGWWIDFFKTDSVSGQLVPFEHIKEALKGGETSGVLFGGKSEGHGGHRFAVNWVIDHVAHPVLLLEREWYAESEERGGRFIDLRAGISMWTYFNPKLIVSVLPEMPAGAVPNAHYKNLFDQTGADLCFASESDPHRWEKVARGKFALFTLIPGVSVQHTTGKVEELWEEEGLDEWLNTTKHVTKMMPDPGEEILDDLESRLEHDLMEI